MQIPKVRHRGEALVTNGRNVLCLYRTPVDPIPIDSIECQSADVDPRHIRLWDGRDRQNKM